MHTLSNKDSINIRGSKFTHTHIHNTLHWAHYQSMMELRGLEAFRAIQCYSCFCWCQHLRTNCPTKHEPEICSRCSATGHNYSDCTQTPKCLNCQGEHPATARICPIYIQAVESQKRIIAEQLAYLILTPPHSPTPSDMLRAAAHEATNEKEFLTSLFGISQNALISESNHVNEIDVAIDHSESDDSHNYDFNETEGSLLDTQNLNDTLGANTAQNNIHNLIRDETEGSPPDTQSLNDTLGAQNNIHNLIGDSYSQKIANPTIIRSKVKSLTRRATTQHSKIIFSNAKFKSLDSVLRIFDLKNDITYLTPPNDNGYLELSIDPGTIKIIQIYPDCIKIITEHGAAYELLVFDMDKGFKLDYKATENLAHWLKSTYSLPLATIIK